MASPSQGAAFPDLTVPLVVAGGALALIFVLLAPGGRGGATKSRPAGHGSKGPSPRNVSPRASAAAGRQTAPAGALVGASPSAGIEKVVSFGSQPPFAVGGKTYTGWLRVLDRALPSRLTPAGRKELDRISPLKIIRNDKPVWFLGPTETTRAPIGVSFSVTLKG